MFHNSPPEATLGNFRLARQDEPEQETAPLTTLDSIISSQHLDRLDLIKVDIVESSKQSAPYVRAAG
jgi:hypothetical protein